VSTLQHEQSLLFDRDLDRKMGAVGPDSPASSWLEAAVALSLRSLPHLAADLTERGLQLYPGETGLWMIHIQSVAIYPEKLQEVWKKLNAGSEPKRGRQILLALTEYYLERDKEGLARLEQVVKEDQGALFFEVCGYYAMARHEYRQALKAYTQAHRLAPRDLRLMVRLGESCRELGQTDRALKWLYRVVQRERHYVQAWNALCRIHLELGHLDRARQAFGMALAVNPRDWGVYFTYADHYLEKKRYGRSRGVLLEVLDLNPSSVIAAEAHNYMGYLYYLEARYSEALTSFQAALELNPSLAVAWFNLGNLHFHLKRMDEAVKCYQEALRADPHMASASCQLGLTYLALGQLELARSPLEKALAEDPNEHWAHLGLSEYHRRSKNPLASLEEARQAIRIAPKDPDAHNYLGIALETNRRYFDAEKAYRRALELDPGQRWAANNLGYLYEKLMRVDPGYKPSAIDAWRIRLRICNETGASVRGAINHLRKLGVPAATIRKWLGEEAERRTGR